MNDVEITEDVCKYAIKGGSVELVHLCEQSGMEFIDCVETAIQYHRFELFEWLNTHFECEFSLCDCLKFSNVPTFFFKISQTADISERDERGMTPLHYASSNGLINVVEFLVSKGADVNEKSEDGTSSLHIASLIGHLNIAEFLVKIINNI